MFSIYIYIYACNLYTVEGKWSPPAESDFDLGVHFYHASTMPCSDFDPFNMRQLVARFKGGFKLLDILLPPVCAHPALVEPNLFSDGSATHPTLPLLSLGGVGIWWPSRKHIGAAVSPSESSVGLEQDWEKGGLSRWGATFGPMLDSTRTEITAGLFAMLADGPVHLASDNQSFVGKANCLRQTLDIKRKDWSLVANGDLWAVFCAVVRAKGPHSVLFSWTKGHAEQEHIDAGISTPFKRDANKQADHNADLGVMCHNEGVTQLLNAYALREDILHQVTVFSNPILLDVSRLRAIFDSSKRPYARLLLAIRVEYPLFSCQGVFHFLT